MDELSEKIFIHLRDCKVHLQTAAHIARCVFDTSKASSSQYRRVLYRLWKLEGLGMVRTYHYSQRTARLWWLRSRVN